MKLPQPSLRPFSPASTDITITTNTSILSPGLNTPKSAPLPLYASQTVPSPLNCLSSPSYAIPADLELGLDSIPLPESLIPIKQISRGSDEYGTNNRSVNCSSQISSSPIETGSPGTGTQCSELEANVSFSQPAEYNLCYSKTMKKSCTHGNQATSSVMDPIQSCYALYQFPIYFSPVIIFRDVVETSRPENLQSICFEKLQRCPFLWCREPFDQHEALVEHIFSSTCLQKELYWCANCQRAETFLPRLDTEDSGRIIEGQQRRCMLRSAFDFMSQLGRGVLNTYKEMVIKREQNRNYTRKPISPMQCLKDKSGVGFEQKFELENVEMKPVQQKDAVELCRTPPHELDGSECALELDGATMTENQKSIHWISDSEDRGEDSQSHQTTNLLQLSQENISKNRTRDTELRKSAQSLKRKRPILHGDGQGVLDPAYSSPSSYRSVLEMLEVDEPIGVGIDSCSLLTDEYQFINETFYDSDSFREDNGQPHGAHHDQRTFYDSDSIEDDEQFHGVHPDQEVLRSLGWCHSESSLQNPKPNIQNTIQSAPKSSNSATERILEECSYGPFPNGHEITFSPARDEDLASIFIPEDITPTTPINLSFHHPESSNELRFGENELQSQERVLGDFFQILRGVLTRSYDKLRLALQADTHLIFLERLPSQEGLIQVGLKAVRKIFTKIIPSEDFELYALLNLAQACAIYTNPQNYIAVYKELFTDCLVWSLTIGAKAEATFVAMLYQLWDPYCGGTKDASWQETSFNGFKMGNDSHNDEDHPNLIYCPVSSSWLDSDEQLKLPDVQDVAGLLDRLQNGKAMRSCMRLFDIVEYTGLLSGHRGPYLCSTEAQSHVLEPELATTASIIETGVINSLMEKIGLEAYHPIVKNAQRLLKHGTSLTLHELELKLSFDARVISESSSLYENFLDEVFYQCGETYSLINQTPDIRHRHYRQAIDAALSKYYSWYGEPIRNHFSIEHLNLEGLRGTPQTRQSSASSNETRLTYFSCYTSDPTTQSPVTQMSFDESRLDYSGIWTDTQSTKVLHEPVLGNDTLEMQYYSPPRTPATCLPNVGFDDKYQNRNDILKGVKSLSPLSSPSTVASSPDGLQEESSLTLEQIVLCCPKCGTPIRGKERNAHQNLSRHIKSVHSDTLLVCRNGDCNTTFTRSDNRSFHERTACIYKLDPRRFGEKNVVPKSSKRTRISISAMTP